jgi:hypothetical protein
MVGSIRSLRSARSRVLIGPGEPGAADHIGGQDRCNLPGFGQGEPFCWGQTSTKDRNLGGLSRLGPNTDIPHATSWRKGRET